LTILTVLTLLACFPAPTQAQGYEFTKIVDSNNGFDPFSFGCPAINDTGVVAFRATRNSGITGIFLGTGGRLTTIADQNDGFGFIGFHPSINNQGQVSFAAGVQTGGEAIMRGDANGLTTIASTEDGPFNFFGFNTSINNAGAVAFKDEGLFVGNGEQIETRYLGSSSRFGGDDSRPSINDAGQVAFFEYLDDGGQGIFVSSDGSFITIADDSGPIDFPTEPTINAAGVVIFLAFLDNAQEAIFTGSGGPLTTVVDSTGPFRFFGFGGPALNDQGQAAFSASLDTDEQGLFIGPDPVADRVIGTGDALDGSTVTNVVFCREGLNNRGQLAFQAQLADERTVIFRATCVASEYAPCRSVPTETRPEMQRVFLPLLNSGSTVSTHSPDVQHATR
jgi:hypothetical protein